MMGAFIGLTMGMSGEEKVADRKIQPNEGIHLSILNALHMGLLVILATLFSFGLVGALIGDLGGALAAGMWYVPSFGFPAVLRYGGFNMIQHYTLRLILTQGGYTPLNYRRFLDYAVDRIFMHRVGSGYQFIHQLLLDHFAAMDETDAESGLANIVSSIDSRLRRVFRPQEISENQLKFSKNCRPDKLKFALRDFHPRCRAAGMVIRL